MKAIITIGVSCSGKSTWAESQENFVVVCRDNIRRIILKYEGKLEPSDNLWSKWKFKREKEVTEWYWKLVEEAKNQSRNIILADTNLNADRRRDMQKRLQELGYDVEFKQFDIDYETAVKRDLYRRDSVGSSVIWKQYKELYGQVYVPPKDAPKAIMVDIDGTLAHMNGRGPFEWCRVGQDGFDEVVRTAVETFGFECGHYIVVLSGRDSICRPETEKWLQENAFNYYELIMRPEGDMRKDSIVKRELFDTHIRDKYNVVAVFDDRPQVCRMWQLMGLKVFQVGDPYEEF